MACQTKRAALLIAAQMVCPQERPSRSTLRPSLSSASFRLCREQHWQGLQQVYDRHSEPHRAVTTKLGLLFMLLPQPFCFRQLCHSSCCAELLLPYGTKARAARGIGQERLRRMPARPEGTCAAELASSPSEWPTRNDLQDGHATNETKLVARSSLVLCWSCMSRVVD